MSDNWISIIPTDPSFKPKTAAAEAARRLMEDVLPEADEVTAALFDEVQFVDAGANSGDVWCPRCGDALEEAWFYETIDEVQGEGGLGDLHVDMPCCGERQPLNDLRWEFPVGFASFALEALNPGVDDLAPEVLQRIGETLGCAVRVIWRHL